MRAILIIAVLLTPIIALAGCGSSEEDDAMAAVCSARDGIAKQVDELSSLTLTTATTSQVTENVQVIRDDLDTIRDSRAQLSDDNRKAVEAANDAFADQIRSLAGTIGRTVSIESARAEVKTSLEQLAASYRDTFGRLDCS
jgi:hypothetical protein